MMEYRFFKKCKITHSVDGKTTDKESFIKSHNKQYAFLYDFIAKNGGKIFENGLFKIHTFESVDRWTTLLADYFREEIEKFNMLCFASNWQGIMYCVDEKNKNIIYFDPATSEYFSAAFSLDEFFNEILVSGEYDVIFEEYFREAMGYLKINELDYENSLGHKQYLHLGGEDDVKNLEIVNTEVLWEMQIQVAEKINRIKQ